MLNPEIWAQGGVTMAVGMGIVFSFLVVMVFAMLIMGKVVAWLNTICPVATPEIKQAKKATDSDESVIAAVIVAAMRGLKK